MYIYNVYNCGFKIEKMAPVCLVFIFLIKWSKGWGKSNCNEWLIGNLLLTVWFLYSNYFHFMEIEE